MQLQPVPVRAQPQPWTRVPLPALPPMHLTPAARLGLVALRLTLGAATAMAVFTFVHGLHG
jgi:hypothetical protein